MNLRKMTQWLLIGVLVGALIAFVSFKEAAIKIDGKTMTLEEYISHEIHSGE
jgi:uncharacterized membrane protein YraQ (UPF0718 family)